MCLCALTLHIETPGGGTEVQTKQRLHVESTPSPLHSRVQNNPQQLWQNATNNDWHTPGFEPGPLDRWLRRAGLLYQVNVVLAWVVEYSATKLCVLLDNEIALYMK